MSITELAYWSVLLFVAYTYLGYPLIVWGLGMWAPRPIDKATLFPHVSIIIPVRNEQHVIARKLDDCLAQDYPANHFEVIVVSDGSTDRTTAIVADYSARHHPKVRLIDLPIPVGKPSALNRGVAIASGDVLVFADARQRFPTDVLTHLVANLADPTVGAASGELHLACVTDSLHGDGLGAYWRFEKFIRRAESRLGTTIGYTGAIAAVRRDLVSPIPADTILDDLVIPLRVAASGHRVVYEPAAKAFDQLSPDRNLEFSRKVRTLAGVIQVALGRRRLIGSLTTSVWWQYVSHKILRLLVPYALAMALLLNFYLDGPAYRVLLAAQLLLYGLGVVAVVGGSHLRRSIFLVLPGTLLLLNTAVIVATMRYARGSRLDLWRPTQPQSVGRP